MKIWQLFSPEKQLSPTSRPPPLCSLVADYALVRMERHGLGHVPHELRLLCSLLPDPAAASTTILAWLEEDVAAASRLVRMANNGVHVTTVDRPVLSLTEAVARIGVSGALEVALTSTIKRLYGLSFEVDPEFGQNLWIHALCTAVTARRIHERLYGAAADHTEAYCAGLIHDLGLPLEHAVLADQGFGAAVENHWHQGTPLVSEELAALEFTHEELGLELARRWELPPATRAAVGFHHRPLPDEAAGGHLTKLLRLADWLGQEYGIGYSDLAKSQTDEYTALRQQLGLTAGDEAEIIRSVALELKKLEKASWFTQYRARVPMCA